MAIPFRGITDKSTYFVTANTADKRFYLQSHRMAGLLVEIMLQYRDEGNFQLHEFVVMPNHLHQLLTPEKVTLERSMQLIKGGFSYRAKREFEFRWQIWQGSYHDRRMRDFSEYARYRGYIHRNPVKERLCAAPKDWEYSSASGLYRLDPVPQRLKPPDF